MAGVAIEAVLECNVIDSGKVRYKATLLVHMRLLDLDRRACATMSSLSIPRPRNTRKSKTRGQNCEQGSREFVRECHINRVFFASNVSLSSSDQWADFKSRAITNMFLPERQSSIGSPTMISKHMSPFKAAFTFH